MCLCVLVCLCVPVHVFVRRHCVPRTFKSLFDELFAAKTSVTFWKSLAVTQMLSLDLKVFPVTVTSPTLAPALGCAHGHTINIATSAVLLPLAGECARM